MAMTPCSVVGVAQTERPTATAPLGLYVWGLSSLPGGLTTWLAWASSWFVGLGVISLLTWWLAFQEGKSGNCQGFLRCRPRIGNATFSLLKQAIGPAQV